MLQKSLRQKRLFILSIIATLCLSGCGSSDSSASNDTAETSPSITITEDASVEAGTASNTGVSESDAITTESAIVDGTSASGTDSSEAEAMPQATIVAYATDIDSASWSEGTLDIRFPELGNTTVNWDNTLPIPLWGKKDVIASIPAPLTNENIKGAGYTLLKEDGSTAASISDGSASSYVIGYTKGDTLDLEYVVVTLDSTALFDTGTPTLQHVLDVLGTPSLGFAYESLEARYYYLYENYYLEVSMTKADSTQTNWEVSEVMYYDASAFLNLDSNQEIASILSSGLSGFTAPYIAPESYQYLTKNP